MPVVITDPPEVGQLVQVRRRRYIVSDVVASALPVDPLMPATNHRQHLVILASVEDDALGEELQVIWELEPGAQVYDHSALPQPIGYDTPQRQDAFLNAVRWGAVASADIRSLQAPFRSGVVIEDYQLDPVVRALEMPRVNLLIADDVGLGKTIEAGLVAQELLIRQRARRILIVCPSALQIQWREQMRDKFGLEFRIVDSGSMRLLRRTRGIHANPWTHFPRLITSVDYIKRDRPLRLLRDVLPAEGEITYPRRFDLLIVDEAANIAPAGRGRYAIDSQRTAAIRLLAPHFEHRLFLTATPHNGYAESFSALLEILDNQRFARGVPPDRNLLASVMVRRLKQDLVDWSGQPRFPARRLAAIEVVHTDAEKQAHRWLQEYTASRQAHCHTPAERTGTEFVLKLLKKRLFSSPAAFQRTLAQHLATLERSPQGSARRPRPRVSEGALRAMVARVEDEYPDDEEYAQAEEDALLASTSLFKTLTPYERKLLGRLHSWSAMAAAQPDSKALALFEWLRTHIRPGGKWSDERVIIFTEYRDTQDWLQEQLAAQGLASAERLQTLYGGMDDEQRERIKAAFQARPDLSPVRILLATDAASEGIDLQLHCRRLVHYEIPWNPSRMEQRNGRVDRHGQQREPLIYHFAPAGYQSLADAPPLDVNRLDGALEFLARAVHKVEQIRQDLGKVGPVIAEQVEEAMLGRRRRLDTAQAEIQAAPLRDMLRFERDLRERVRALYDKVQQSEQALHLRPENVQEAVAVALELAGQAPLLEAQVAGVWPDPSGRYDRCPVFHLQRLTGSWARCSEGLEHPHTGVPRPIVFDRHLAEGRDDVVLAHLNHRLVQMSLRLLRAEVWNALPSQGLYRVAARLVPDTALDGPAVIAHGRLVVVGGNKTRLHEEILSAGGLVTEGRLRRMNVTDVQRALAEATDAEPSPATKETLTAVWPEVSQALAAALEARMRERTTAVGRLLERRREKEAADITAVLGELERLITQELQTAPRQLELEGFSTSEREQYQRNVNALEARLAQIPGELDAELGAIAARFADPQSQLFPVAVTFLVPRRLA